ncbi:hypothetical protein GF340_05025 [Candidatus Peregrinibacteria bacterium]|nr:hypothetical protein [Candidatus Peregrinibacteria bacterium]
MDKSIENIGLLKYTWTILTGKNRQIEYFAEKGERIRGEFIITLGKNAVILTNISEGKRIPIIVRPWEKIEDNNLFMRITKFIDNKNFEWIFSSQNGNEFIEVNDENGDELYTMNLK